MELYLTCSKDGFISLWDEPQDNNGEGTPIILKLTKEQEEDIVLAMRKSKDFIGGPGEYGPYYQEH